uniref:Uncharacterized protein n=1 Tax=Pseudonaja textilis TaxID=8673 RepID=A0A670Y7Y9_PSETE
MVSGTCRNIAKILSILHRKRPIHTKTSITMLIILIASALHQLSSVPPTPPKNLDSMTSITTGEKDFEADDLMSISELGRGAYRCLQDSAEKNPSHCNTEEEKRLAMDLDVSMRTVDCFYIDTYYGALFRESEPKKAQMPRHPPNAAS